MKAIFSNTYMVFFGILFVMMFAFMFIFSMKYLRANRVKNKVVTLLEQNETVASATAAIEAYLEYMKFNSNEQEGKNNCPDGVMISPNKYNICIKETKVDQGNILKGRYYTISVPIDFEMIFNIKKTIYIEGNTNIIYNYK